MKVSSSNADIERSAMNVERSISDENEGNTDALIMLKSNQEHFCFFDLPAEVRNCVYRYVLGGAVFRFGVFFQNQLPEETWKQPEEAVKKQKSQWPYLLVDSIPARFCSNLEDDEFKWLSSAALFSQYRGYNARLGIDLQLLRVCKQICHEADLVLYSSNVFHTDPRVLYRFMLAGVSERQARAIRAIIYGDLLHPAIFNTIIENEKMQSLLNLVFLRIDLNDIAISLINPIEDRCCRYQEVLDKMTAGLLAVSRPSLRVAVFLVESWSTERVGVTDELRKHTEQLQTRMLDKASFRLKG